jgi:hypothetical protein
LVGVGTAGWYKRYENVGSATLGTLDVRLRFYPSTINGFFLTTGVGLGVARVAFDDIFDIGTETRTGPAFIVGLGYDIPLGNTVKLTPYLNGFAVRLHDDFTGGHTTSNVGQVGLGLTIYNIRSNQEPVMAPTPAERSYTAAPSPVLPAAPPFATMVEPESPPVQAYPAGTMFLGDTRLKLYYSVECEKGIPTQFQVLFQSAAGAERDGFVRSGDC